MNIFDFGKVKPFIEKEINGILHSRICRSDAIYEGKGIKIQFPDDIDMQVAVFRLKGTLYAIHNICPHRHADRMHEGIIRGHHVTCPLHGWTYDVHNGQNTNQNQGKKGLKSYSVLEEDSWVWLEKPQYEIIPKWRRE